MVWILIIVAIAIAVILVAGKAKPRVNAGAFEYAARPMFHSKAERDAYPKLVAGLTGYIVAPQVCMSAFVKVSGKDALRGRGLIKSRYVDFLITDMAGTPKAVIELDGPSHGTAEGKSGDAARDALLERAGLRVLRFPSADGIDLARIKQQIGNS